MSADVLLSRLGGVRRSGKGWRANCPNGHSHGKGSLSIAVADDGRTLLHCFACADVPGILTAVGLEVADLFPRRIDDPSPEGRRAARESFRQAGWRAALGVLSREARIVGLAGHDLAGGRSLARVDRERLLAACDRIDAARAVLIDNDHERARG